MSRTEAELSVREGRLDDALAQLQDAVRNDPSSAELRIFLFQLLSLLGQWDRARNQLNVVAEMQSDTDPMAQTYDLAISCERLREEIFAGRRAPLVFGQPTEWVALLLQALELDGAGHKDEAQEIRLSALEKAPATSGRIKPRVAEGGDADASFPFEWLSDGDTRIGPVIEAIMDGKFYWIPMDRVSHIGIDLPEDLRDFVWIPVGLTFANGGQKVALVPSRYPGSGSDEDPAIRMSRKTDWVDAGENLFEGRGQRMWMTDSGEYPLFDVREIELDVEAPEVPAEDSEEPEEPTDG